jgi:hypothetical protein
MLAASQVSGRRLMSTIVIRRSWPGQSAQACSSDVFPLSAGAEMIVTRFATARPSVRPARAADQPIPGRTRRATSEAAMPVIVPSPLGIRSG